MTTKQWSISISHPDYCPNPNTYLVSTAQLSEMTRNEEFSDMIDRSDVLIGLIAAVEAIQDKTH